MKLSTQGQLNDLVRDLALSKETAEILASHFSEHRVLDSEAKITFYRRREGELIRYFSEEENFVLWQHPRPSFINGTVPEQSK